MDATCGSTNVKFSVTEDASIVENCESADAMGRRQSPECSFEECGSDLLRTEKMLGIGAFRRLGRVTWLSRGWRSLFSSFSGVWPMATLGFRQNRLGRCREVYNVQDVGESIAEQ